MTESDPRVVLLVPVYNRREITREFLAALRMVEYPSLEVVIVDDGSPDGTAEMIRREFPEVRLLQTPGDYWWSKCMNAGLQYALPRKPDYVLTLNDDVSFDPGFVRVLVDYAEQHPRTLVGSFVYHHDMPEKVWYAGGKIAWFRGELLHRTSLVDGRLGWLTAMGVLIPACAFAEVGMYDAEQFPQYTADAEFSIRARKAGFSLAVVPQSIIWNKTEVSAQRIVRQQVNFRTFLLPLWSNRSDAKLRMRWALYRRHWPTLLLPVVLVVYYAKFMAKQSKRFLLGAWRSAQ